MNITAFRSFLKKRKFPVDKIPAAVALAERFEAFVLSNGGQPDASTTWAFCRNLIHERQNTHDNLLVLARYGQFIRNNQTYVAVLELLDGEEAQPNLYRKVGERFGENVRDQVFAGIGIAPLGIPSSDKPRYIFPVLERLIKRVGQQKVEQLLSACLRDLPDEHFEKPGGGQLRLSGIDAHARKRHRSLLRQLRKCQRAGELFFAQQITKDVVDLVKNNPEIESGVRHGNILYVSKIPYNTVLYLAEKDPVLKRYYACHCPWAREAIRNGSVRLDPVFCNCSGGYSKKPWESLLGQTLKVDVLESALKGDLRCRFAIHLPESLQIA